jgi:nitrate reductase assembly molybdenum cofactor insertion protein NarJ
MKPEVIALLHEAAEWRLLSILFEYPGEDWRERLIAISTDLCDAQLREASEAALREASPGMHHSIFGPGGPVSLREASYTNGVQLGYLLSEIAAFYNAFAYTPDVAEPVDHISVEAGFIAYMRFKQAYALACGEDDRTSVTTEASSEFLREHLARMAARMATALGPIAPRYLVTAGDALAARAGRPPVELGTLSVLNDDEESLCGVLH